MKVKSDVGYVTLVTALPVESAAVRKFLDLRQTEVGATGTRYETGVFHGAGVVLLETGAGNVDAAIEVEKAVEKYRSRYLFFIGVAGGIKDVKIGDVVAATKIYNYESGKADQEFLPRPKMGESSYYLVQLAKSVARSETWKTAVGSGDPASAYISPIVAGEKVIISLDAAELAVIRSTYSDAVAVEMEGYGVLRVGYSREEVRMIVIRGISDMLGGKSNADASGSQETASARAAGFAFQMLLDLLDELRPIPQSAWETLESLAVSLYPVGPTHQGIWSRAGGDLSILELMQSGKSAWHGAITQLRNGGGGKEITFMSLIAGMLEDFPNNRDLQEIARSAA
jgi:adenosylhomocysteine nucleosidase